MSDKSQARLDRLSALEERVPYEDRTKCLDVFVGALALHVSDNAWDAAIETASFLAVDEES